MLERSKMTDLVVDCDISQITNTAIIKEVFDNHAARIREINLRGLTPWFLYSILQKASESSESLRLRSLQLWHTFSTEEEGNPYFPAHLLVQPSGLQRLEIRRCDLDWYTEQHPLLTHLVVEKIHDRPLLSEFATILSEMPALETLGMVDSLPLAPRAMKLSLKVALSRLSSLHLSSTENVFEVLNVLDFLIVPCTTRVRLACVEITAQVIQLPHIGFPLSVFLSNMTGNIKRSYNQLSLSYFENDFCFSAFTNEQPHVPMSTHLLDLDLTLTHSNHQLDHFLDRILPGIPLFNLQTLFIDITFGHDTIVEYFGQFITLQSVELQFHVVVSDFLRAITPKPEGYEHLESSVPFPALQSLGFFHISFCHFNLEEVLDFLMERYERGVGLQKLCIRKRRRRPCTVQGQEVGHP